MSEDRAGVDQAVPAGGRGPDTGAGAATAELPLSGSVPLDAVSLDSSARDSSARDSSARDSSLREAPRDAHRSDVAPAGEAGPARTAEPLARAVAPPARSARRGRQDPPAPPPVAGPATPARSGKPGVRRARLAVRRVDPWSVFVLSLLISLFLGVVLLVAVGLLYLLLQKAGVLTSVDTFARELSLIQQDATIITASRVMSVAGIVAAVDVVVLTVLATLAAVLYNVCASFTGGIEVTLAERE